MVVASQSVLGPAAWLCLSAYLASFLWPLCIVQFEVRSVTLDGHVPFSVCNSVAISCLYGQRGEKAFDSLFCLCALSHFISNSDFDAVEPERLTDRKFNYSKFGLSEVETSTCICFYTLDRYSIERSPSPALNLFCGLS